ncbi:aldo-keto reductase 1B-like [Apostichopus japonicus]|uniref:aldo-keto reductase 1B-like n=1 Tax=Stichopus japonicus TaxID=307972 RepID=UPI003AB66628
MTGNSKNTFITFSDGNKMPAIGLGTWQSEPGEVQNAIKAAVKCGYRHIDCAYFYRNENEIGEALAELFKEGTVKREELFITTKLWAIFHRPDRVEYALNLSLKALKLDYVDLYLMHSAMAFQHKGDDIMFPEPEDGSPGLAIDETIHYLDTWKEMEGLVAKGLAKSIGVSNFSKEQLGEVLRVTKIPCVNNQIENHPCLNQEELINFCKANNVSVTSYSPIGSPDRSWAADSDPNLRENPVVMEIAKVKGCTPVQVLVAYNLIQGLSCVPKSRSAERIEQNFLSLDVKLTDTDIKNLDELQCNFRAIPWELERMFLLLPSFGESFIDRIELSIMNLSLKALQLDYVDLYLMHSPMAFQHAGDTVMYPPTEGNPDRVLNDDVDYLDTWKAMESLVGKGLTKSIGVSNFNIEQLGKLMNIAKVPCVNNQIENHPCLEQAELINFCKSNNVTVTSYSPLGSPDRSDASDKDPNLREDPVVLEMAKAKRCTPVQLLIAYHLNQGLICIPKSKSTKRIEENFMSLDVNLSEDEIKKLDGLSCSYRALHWDFAIENKYYPF